MLVLNSRNKSYIKLMLAIIYIIISNLVHMALPECLHDQKTRIIRVIHNFLLYGNIRINCDLPTILIYFKICTINIKYSSS